MSATAPESMVVALDVGGSSVKSGVFAPTGELLALPVTTPIESRGTAEQIFNALAAVAGRAREVGQGGGGAAGEGTAWRLALGFPGPFDYAGGISGIRGLEKYEAIFGLDVRAALSARLGLAGADIVFMNDAAAAVVGEARSGAGRGCARVIGVTLGTGLGSAFVRDGVAVNANACHGVPEGGWLYPCAWRGARADDWFSTRGLRARAAAAGLAEADGPTLVARARAGDAMALTIWEGFGAELGAFLRPHAEAFGAQAVLVLGGLGAAWEFFSPSLRRELGAVDTGPGELGANAALEGLRGFAVSAA